MHYVNECPHKCSNMNVCVCVCVCMCVHGCVKCWVREEQRNAAVVEQIMIHGYKR